MSVPEPMKLESASGKGGGGEEGESAAAYERAGGRAMLDV
jgi:hypothetical protein